MNRANIYILVLEEQWEDDLWPEMRGTYTPPSSLGVERDCVVEEQAKYSVCDYVGDRMRDYGKEGGRADFVVFLHNNS